MQIIDSIAPSVKTFQYPPFTRGGKAESPLEFSNGYSKMKVKC